MKKRVLAVVMCALMAGTAFTGFKDAGDDKELVLFTWEGMFPQEVLDDFEKETGVKVVYSNFDTDETMLEKLSMAKGGVTFTTASRSCVSTGFGFSINSNFPFETYV